MRILDPIRRHPIVILGLVLAGIAVWNAMEWLDPTPITPRMESGEKLVPVPLSIAMLDGSLPPRESRPIPRAILPRLKPGMTRTQVEDMIGPPTANSLQPVTVAEGRATYRASYELAEPPAPPTVRPIGPGPRGPLHVALEFDATKPGHPLLDVMYLDPLF
jgi:hypothetical protein